MMLHNKPTSITMSSIQE